MGVPFIELQKMDEKMIAIEAAGKPTQGWPVREIPWKVGGFPSLCFGNKLIQRAGGKLRDKFLIDPSSKCCRMMSFFPEGQQYGLHFG